MTSSFLFHEVFLFLNGDVMASFINDVKVTMNMYESRLISAQSKLAQVQVISKKLSYLCEVCNQPSIFINKPPEISTFPLPEFHRLGFSKGLTYSMASFPLSVDTWSICHLSLIGSPPLDWTGDI